MHSCISSSLFLRSHSYYILFDHDGSHYSDIRVTLSLLNMIVNISGLEHHANSTQTKKMCDLGWKEEDLGLTRYVMETNILMLLFSGVVAVIMSFFWIRQVDIHIGHYLVPLCRRLALCGLMFLVPVQEPPDQ